MIICPAAFTTTSTPPNASIVSANSRSTSSSSATSARTRERCHLGEDLLDGGVGLTLIPRVVEHNGEALAGQLAGDLAATPREPPRDDRHAVGPHRFFWVRDHA